MNQVQITGFRCNDCNHSSGVMVTTDNALVKDEHGNEKVVCPNCQSKNTEYKMKV